MSEMPPVYGQNGVNVMKCRLVDMREKQVICIKDGTVIGMMCDVIIDTSCGKVVSIVILGRARCWGLFGREEDIIIPWECIEVLGEETILVNFDLPPRHRKRGFFKNRFYEE